MTDRKGVLVRFPPDMLADLDAEAKRTGKSRHDVILARCSPREPDISLISPSPKGPAPHTRSKTVLAPAKRARVDAPPAAERTAHVHVGYPEFKPGSLSKKR